MNYRILTATALLVTLATSASTVMAQTASQGFRVVVPTGLSIVAPTDAQITHDETDNDNLFPPQTWVVKGNASNGLTVTFATQDVFKHSSGNFQRDAGLSIALGTTQGPATWNIVTASDQTDYAASDPIAEVSASSNGVGRANIDLTVSFVTEEFGVFAAGDYDMTVVGTVAAN
ncbi:MAG TPA: hypothetical protein DDW52_02460 [Planctomycetaceae bacterium]|nr:hypothetical protein [Planctomycetaceae bacterium]